MCLIANHHLTQKHHNAKFFCRSNIYTHTIQFQINHFDFRIIFGPVLCKFFFYFFYNKSIYPGEEETVFKSFSSGLII